MTNNISIDKNKWQKNKPNSYYISQLDYINFDKSINKVNEKLSKIEYSSPFSYTSIDAEIKKANELLEELYNYIGGTLEDINECIDEPFFKRFDNKVGILEKFERINLDDYKTENKLGIEEHESISVYDYTSGRYNTKNYTKKVDKIGFSDLLNNKDVKGYKGMPSFAEMMKNQYSSVVENANMDLSYDDYVEAILKRSDVQHTVDRGWLNFLSDSLDTVGIVSAVAMFTGENFVTGELLTNAEKKTAGITTAINVGLLTVTILTAGAGSIAAVGMKAAAGQTAKVVTKSLAIDMISGTAGLATVNILDNAGSPEWLSMVAGLGVSFAGGYYGNKITGIGTAKESGEIKSFADLMSPEDAARYNGLAERLQYYQILKDGVIEDTAWEYLKKYTSKNGIELRSIKWNEQVSMINKYKKEILNNTKRMRIIESKSEKLLKLSDVRLQELNNMGYSTNDFYSILNTDKSIRTADKYFKTVENTKIQDFWNNAFYGNDSKVVISYMPKDAYENFVLGYGTIGRGGEKGGQFVLPQSIGESIESKLINKGSLLNTTNEFKSELAKELGLPTSVFESGVIKVEIPIGDNIDLKMVTGVEDGCNYQWIPGGKTLGGTTEGIIRQITSTNDKELFDDIVRRINEKIQ